MRSRLPRGGSETFSCVEGACKLKCVTNALDCDGLADNGCESGLQHNDHCGSCDKKCLDPNRPCSYQDGVVRGNLDCGCPDGKISCLDPASIPRLMTPIARHATTAAIRREAARLRFRIPTTDALLANAGLSNAAPSLTTAMALHRTVADVARDRTTVAPADTHARMAKRATWTATVTLYACVQQD